jgi:hypothetical protein
VLHFACSIQLTKEEVFGACQALADADRHLVRAGCFAEADALGELFQLFEERLAAVGPCPSLPRHPLPRPPTSAHVGGTRQ